MTEQFGFKVIGTITRTKGECAVGHKLGDRFELHGRSSGGLCGYFYYNVFPYIIMLQCGGSWPDEKGLPEFDCPDKDNAVTIKLERESS